MVANSLRYNIVRASYCVMQCHGVTLLHQYFRFVDFCFKHVTELLKGVSLLNPWISKQDLQKVQYVVYML